VVGGDAGSAYMRMVLILKGCGTRIIATGFIRPGKGDCNAVASFWGVLHDREDFGPISGGKTFRDHGAARGEHARVDAAGDESWETGT